MNMTNEAKEADYRMQLRFAVPGERLFTALTTENGVRGWWTEFCEVSDKVSGVSSFRFPAAGFFAVMRTLRRESPKLLEWECIDSKHDESTGYSDLRDWVGTRILFEIRDDGKGHSELGFTHFRLGELECLDSCRSGWTFFLNESLRGYLEKGQGQPWDKA